MHQLYLVGHIDHTYYQTRLPQMANDRRILHSIGTDGYRTDLAIFYLNDYTNVNIIIQSYFKKCQLTGNRYLPCRLSKYTISRLVGSPTCPGSCG